MATSFAPIGSIVTPTSVIFVSSVVQFTTTVYKLDENNSWEVVQTFDTPVTEQTVTLSSDGVYYFHLEEYGNTGESIFVYICYEEVKAKLRSYIKSILCSCCEDDCNPCSNETVYDFNMLHHLSLSYLGSNEFLLIQTDITDVTTLDKLHSINNAIVRTKKYILNYDI
jgi:hypothetical protein